MKTPPTHTFGLFFSFESQTTVVSVRKPRRPGLKDSADMWELVDETAVANADSPRGGRKMSRPHLRPPRDDLHDSSDMTDLAALAPKVRGFRPGCLPVDCRDCCSQCGGWEA